MSATPQGPAAVFNQQRQDVEVFVEGAWWPGSILGWRHDDAASCRVWVQASVDGVERSTVTDLDALRLPAAPGSPAAGPAAAAGSVPDAGPVPATVVAAAAPAPGARAVVEPAPVRGRRRHGCDVTAELPAVRSGGPGRHRAPIPVGRHRAEEEAAAGAGRAGADCMTRPIRLGDRTPWPRASLSGGVRGA